MVFLAAMFFQVAATDDTQPESPVIDVLHLQLYLKEFNLVKIKAY